MDNGMAAQTKNNSNNSTIIQRLSGLGSSNSNLTAIVERRKQIQELGGDYDQKSFVEVESTAVASSQGPVRLSTPKLVKHSHSALGVSETSFPTGLGSPTTNKSSSASSSASPSAPSVSCQQNLAPAEMTTHNREAECEPLHQKYKREWRAWCASKMYHDGDKVTPGKMAAYMDGLFDNDDPQIRYDIYSRLTSIRHNFLEQHVVLETPTEFYEASLKKFQESDTAGTDETVRLRNENLGLSPTTSRTSTVRSPPTSANSNNCHSYGTDPKVAQEIEEIRSGMEAMSNRFLVELASARISITEQLAAQLEATRAAICNRVTAETASLEALVEGHHPRINGDNDSTSPSSAKRRRCFDTGPGSVEATDSAVQASILSEPSPNPSTSVSLASDINIHPPASDDSKSVQHQHAAPMDVNNSAADQKESLSTYHQNWNAWCITGGFDDSDKVTGAKILAYMQGLIQKIEPFGRTHPHAQGGPSLDILWRHFDAIQELYLDQCKENGMLPAQQGPLMLDEFRILLYRYQTGLDKLSGSQRTPAAALEHNVVVQEGGFENQVCKDLPSSLVLAETLRLGAISTEQTVTRVDGQIAMSEPCVSEAILKSRSHEVAMRGAGAQVVMSTPYVLEGIPRAVLSEKAEEGTSCNVLMNGPFVPEAISNVMTTEQAMDGAVGHVVMSEPCMPKARARKSLTKRAADISMKRSYDGFVNLTTTMESGQAKIVPLVTNARLKSSVSAPAETNSSIDVPADQNIKAQVEPATALTLKRQEDEEVCLNPSHSPSTPTKAAFIGTETLLDQNPRLHDDVATPRMNGDGEGWRQDNVHSKSKKASTYYDLIPARFAREELSRSSASPAVFSSLATINHSPTALNSSNSDADKRPRDTELDIIQELNEIKSMLVSMISRPTSELELTKSTLVEQLCAELTVARTSMAAQLAADLESTRKSMTKQLSAELDTARISMGSQFSAVIGATRTAMITQLSAGLEASLNGFGTKCFAELKAREASMRNELLAEVEANHVAMKDQLSAELEATQEAMSKQLATELEATRVLMGQKISAELSVVPESVSSQVTAGIEGTLASMSEQLSTGFETALKDMGDTVSEAIMSVQASVDGVHLRMGEIERSIRGLWTTMAAERVDPWRALQDANDVHGKRPRRD